VSLPASAIRAAHPLLAELPEETLRRLQIYAALLEKWQRAINLVGKSSLQDLWVRHFADSLQVSDGLQKPGVGSISDLAPDFGGL
jgi:16S rRNA (guanine527-N7)-methyltransferase